MPNGKTPKELGYETEDVGWTFVLVFFGILSVVTVASVFGLLWVWSARDLVASMGDVAPVATAEERPLPTGPRLQARPPVDMDAYKTGAFEHLANYGWLDEHTGKVHIPIKRAMELALEQGFAAGAPVAAPTQPDAATEEPVVEDEE